MSKILSKLDEIQLRLIIQPKKYLFFTAGLGLILILVIIYFVFIPTEHEMSSTGYTIFDFQISWNKQNADIILSSWADILDVVIFQTVFDYVFVVGNILFMSSIFLLLAKTVKSSQRSLSKVGMWVAVGGGSFDAIENLFTLFILTSASSYPALFPFLQSLFATLKFLCLGCEIILLIGIALSLIKGIAVRNN